MKTSKIAIGAVLAVAAIGAPSVVALDMDAMKAHAAQIPSQLETKDDADITASVDEIKGLVEKQNEAFKAHEDLIGEIQKKGEDYLTEDSLSKINDELNAVTKQIESLTTAVNRPGSQAESGDDEVKEHKEAFSRFIAKGDDTGLGEIESKALSIGVDADGGYAVPEELDREITDLSRKAGAMRTLATTRQVTTEGYKKLVNIGGTTSGWVGETDARTETNTSQLTPVTPPMGEIYANGASTQRALDDVMFSAEQFILDEMGMEFADKEADAFLNGDGINMPKGLLTYTTALTGDDTRAFGTMQHFATGVAADLPATAAATEDLLIDLAYGVARRYRAMGSFLMNGTIVSKIRKMRDGDGRSLWQPSSQAGEPASLLGFGVQVDDFMPNVGANALPIAFGDFRRAYYILDRVGTRVLRDPYTNKPHVNFYATRRVGGGVVNSEAVKFIKCVI